MNELFKKISLTGIVPVIKIDDADQAVPLAKALCAGGIPVAEVTLRTEQAEEAIARMKACIPEMLVGAGTVLTVAQVDRMIKAGAEFIVTPGFNATVVGYCVNHDIPIIPGCNNPSDVEQAISYGLETVKFFPAEASGGLRMIKALSGPYHNMKFIPTGGIDLSNLNDYLSYSKVIACGGSWMVPEKLIKEGDYDAITRLARAAVDQILGFQLAHLGINCEDEIRAESTARGFSELFHLEVNPGNSSFFAGDIIELMKSPYKGAHGHIAISTNDIERAIDYLLRNGHTFDENSAKYDSAGKLATIYLNEEFGGFAVHLMQRKRGEAHE